MLAPRVHTGASVERQMPDLQEVEAASTSTLVLTVLGGAGLERVSGDGTRSTILGPGKPLSLLAYLAFAPAKTASRDHLADVFWSEQDPEAARHSLRHTLWMLRHLLGDAALTATNGSIKLAATVASDRDAFLAAVERQEFELAVDLYHGDFLPAFAAPGAADFEHWADVERYRLRHTFRRIAEAVVREWLAKGRLRKARQLAARVRDADRSDESAWRLLLECLLAADDPVAAELEAQELERALEIESHPPEPATVRVLERVKARPDSTTSAPTTPSTPNLLTDLIGREAEFSAVLAAWDRARLGTGRHVHVIGAAGLGKTRLLTDLLSRIRSTGAHAISVRAKPGEQQVSFALVSDLAAAAADLPGAKAVSEGVAASLVALNPGLSSHYAAAPDRSSDVEALRRREIAIGELLTTVAREQPLALFVDDLHWADRQSTLILRSVIERVAGSRLLLVTSARPQPEGEVRAQHSELLTLRPLTQEDTRALLASAGILPTDAWARALPEALYAAAQGSPLLTLETLRLLLERELLILEGGQWRSSDPPALQSELAKGGALRQRIGDLDRHRAWILLLLSEAGMPLGLPLLATAAGRSQDAVTEDLTALEVRGLVNHAGDGWQPAHDLIAERANEMASDDGRRAVHRALGLTLGQSAGADPAVLQAAGRHLALSGQSLQLRRVFVAWARIARSQGDRRRLQRLAGDFLSWAPEGDEAERLLRNLSVVSRARLMTARSLASAAAVAALLASTGAFILLRAPVPPPDADFLAAYRVTGDSALVYDVGVRRDRWTERASINVRQAGRPFPVLSHVAAAAFAYGGLATATDGERWAFTKQTPGPGATEVFLTGMNGVARQLTSAPKDNTAGDWSPDGQMLAIQTGRWNASGRENLALLDPRSGRATRLTSGDNSDDVPRWSPDGTRLAFARQLVPGGRADSGATGQVLCWVAVSGGTPHCFPLPLPVLSVVGWYDANQVLATVADTTGRYVLMRVNLESHDAHAAGGDMFGTFRASPDGRWIACRCGRPGVQGLAWYVFPSDRPDLTVPLTGLGDANRAMVFWRRSARGPGYIARVVIVGSSGPVALGSVLRLGAVGYDAAGTQVPTPLVRWRSSDSTVASVDSLTGDLRPHRVGTTMIHVSAGGWRADSVRVTVGPPVYSELMKEDWTNGLEAWVPFGVPRPAVTTGPDGRPAFWNNGDRSFYSGAYSRSGFTSRSGVGLDLTVYSPMTAFQDQIWNISLVAWTDSLTVARWDRRTGSLPTGAMQTCTLTYPPEDGPAGLGAVALTAFDAAGRDLPSRRRIAHGAPYVVRIQIFADGRCGLALDGQALWIAPSRLPLNVPYRVLLQGKSVGNRMLIGHLEVWAGVKPGVDWSRAPR